MTEPAGTLTPLSETGQTIEDPGQDIRGRKVVDSNGDQVGTVTDLLIDTGDQTVRFLHVEHGGILGFGAASSFIPVGAVRRVTDDEVLVDSSKHHIAGAPRYDPELVEQRGYYDEVHGYYGYPPFGAPGVLHPGLPLGR